VFTHFARQEVAHLRILPVPATSASIIFRNEISTHLHPQDLYCVEMCSSVLNNVKVMPAVPVLSKIKVTRGVITGMKENRITNVVIDRNKIGAHARSLVVRKVKSSHLVLFFDTVRQDVAQIGLFVGGRDGNVICSSLCFFSL